MVPWERAGAPRHAGAVRLAGGMAVGRSPCLSDLHSLGSKQMSSSLLGRWLHVLELLACATLLAPGHGTGSCLRSRTEEGGRVHPCVPLCDRGPAGVRRVPSQQVSVLPSILKDLPAWLSLLQTWGICRLCRNEDFPIPADSTPCDCSMFGSQLGYSCGCEGPRAVASPRTVLGYMR